MNPNYFLYGVYAWSILAVITFFFLTFKTVAPFGRHTRTDFGPMINNTVGWVIMELISLLVFSYFFFTGSVEKTAINYFLAGLWMLHYFNRSLIYPFRQRNHQKSMPVAIMLSAVFFNLLNGFFNGYYLGNISDFSQSTWMNWIFLSGLLLFIGGFAINFISDQKLISLRKPGESDYKIPHGFLFRWVSCPNHLGEIIEWTGFALMAMNPAAWSFALWTFANLAPRSIAHHRWYHKHFKDYPKNRKAVIPGVF